MALLEMDGLHDLQISVEKMAAIPRSVKAEMLKAGAAVIVEAQKNKAVEMGVIDTGELVKSIEAGRPSISADGAKIDIYPQGERTRGKTTTSNAKIAYVNEYGKPGQPARPFMRTANEAAADDANGAAEKIYNEWLDSVGL